MTWQIAKPYALQAFTWLAIHLSYAQGVLMRRDNKSLGMNVLLQIENLYRVDYIRLLYNGYQLEL